MAGRAPIRQAAAGTIIAILAILVLAADQFAKYLAIKNLPPEEPVHVIGNFLIFYLVRNPGAAFSLGESVTWLFTIALAVVAVIVVWLAIARVRSRLWAVALGLLLGGVLGNLTDRLFRPPGFAVGHVVDFILTPWMMPAIYNVADSFIVTMMIGVALLVLFGPHLNGMSRRAVADEADAAAAAAGDDAPAADGAAAEEGAAAADAADAEAATGDAVASAEAPDASGDAQAEASSTRE